MEYKILEDTNIKIFGDDFVENNKEICKIIIGENEEELCLSYETKNIKLKEDKILKIRLKGIKNITDLSSMFLFCDNLISYSYINFDTSKYINMSNIFCGCKLLENIPDISKWNTENVTDISGLFSGCSSLKLIPDISGWNISNVTDINNLFSAFTFITSLPDLSK